MKNTIIKYLRYIINRLEVKPHQDNTKSISSLAPKILTEKEDLERISPYTNRLKDAIDTKGITNIALTGGYGSGKSTILNTFQHFLYPNYEYINISLASFKDNKKGDKEERKLEISILQQIFYHVKPSRIPDSRFKRIIDLSDKKLFSFSLGLIVWVISTFILFKFNYIQNLNPSIWDTSKQIVWGAFFTTAISSIIFFFGVGCFSRMIIRLFTNSKINKFNIKGEIELGNEIDKSVFNEHLEEIVYFFQRTEYNVVIIEDLDRFDTTDIFTKLREINILLNKSELLKGREINFIYAIRDEMFTDKNERVKFFEYIIPIIPFINPSNAAEQLAKLIKESNLEGVLSKNFTEDVVTFIDDIDMRLLTNMFHEYVLYKDKLKELNQEENLFSIITYKNIFPEDFGKLHKREGYLYEFISNKNNYINQLTAIYKKNISEKELEIRNIQKEIVANIKELRAIYIQFILHKTPIALAFKIDDGEISFSEIIDDTHFKNFITLPKIEYYYHSIQHRNYNNSYLIKEFATTNYSFKDLESEINNNFTYKEREQAIEKRDNGKINKLKKEISDIENKIFEIQNWNLSKVLQEIGVDKILDKDKVVIENDKKDKIISPLEHPLIINLLLNGYIDENYNDYISLFHGVSMTAQEFSFIRKVKSGIRENYNYELINIDQIIKKLDQRYFSYDAILNFDLFDYLSENYSLHKDRYTALLKLMIKKADNLKFIDEYIHSEREYIPQFIEKLSEYWNKFWDYIYEHPTFEYTKKNYYLYLILTHAKLDSIYSLNINLQLADYIETHEEFISLFTDSTYYGKIISVLKKLDIHFETLELPNDQNKSLFQNIYENNHYSINQHNIVLLLNYLPYIEGGSESIQCWNFTTILNSHCEPLKNYIENNLTDYLEKVFLKLPHNANESEETILHLLNNNDLPIELRAKIIDKQVTKITDNSKSKHLEIDTLLFEKNKLKASWNNIINYFDNLEEKVIDDALIKFLNIEENYNALNQENISKKNEEVKDLETQLIYSNQLSIDAYKSLVIKTPYNWNSIDFSSLDPNKVEWLIENKLNLTKYNFDKLKHDFISLSIKLLEKYSHQLLEKYDELEFDIDDHIEILESKIISQSIKERIIPKIDNEWILENDKLKMLIKNILYKSNEALLEYGVLESIVRYSKNNDKRLHLIYNHMKGLTNEEIQILIKQLGVKYEKIFEVRKRREFDYKEKKNAIFKVLEERKMISSATPNEDKTKINVVALYD